MEGRNQKIKHTNRKKQIFGISDVIPCISDMNTNKRIGCDDERSQNTKAGFGIQTNWKWESLDPGRGNGKTTIRIKQLSLILHLLLLLLPLLLLILLPPLLLLLLLLLLLPPLLLLYCCYNKNKNNNNYYYYCYYCYYYYYYY